MLQSAQILLVGDQFERNKLEVIFEFLGLQVIAGDTSEWPQLTASVDSELNTVAAVSCAPVSSESQAWLESVREWDDTLPVILVGKDAAIADDWSDTIKRTVVACLEPPLSLTQVTDALYQAQSYRKAQQGFKNVSGQSVPQFRSLVGSTAAMEVVRSMMAQVADKDVSVLITGESGTGKEVVARNLHFNSERRDKPFVPVNCGAIPAELLESELFGHEKGAFTGAVSSRAGRFEMAEGGTLFLDEIGDMPLNMQVKILRVLQERSFERVGGNKMISANVRVIAATHRDLEKMIDEETFREDLFYCLNVFPIEMPALRERADDIPLIINELVSRMEKDQRGFVRFNSSAIMSLSQHDWSGNVRELSNLVERMSIMFPNGVVGAQDLPRKYRHIDVEDIEIEPNVEAPAPQAGVVNVGDTALLPEQGIDLKEYLTTLERNLIQQALDDSGSVVARAAERLGIRRTTLVEKMRKYDLQR
ncbi:MAG: transcriptional regulator FleQ [Candidatus Pelagadaptatus aseana]|uniref:sigma-54 dependent transcriptional regulator n=1 Tax=Candidatus Pelagadaptatus aseana TaxID=3120508 RepID=UPI0039B23C38